jgi:hypothetical protein
LIDKRSSIYLYVKLKALASWIFLSFTASEETPTHMSIKTNRLEEEHKETTDTASSASFLDLYLELDDSGQLSTKIYDKRDDFNFKIINFPNMCSNIPASHF